MALRLFIMLCDHHHLPFPELKKKNHPNLKLSSYSAVTWLFSASASHCSPFSANFTHHGGVAYLSMTLSLLSLSTLLDLPLLPRTLLGLTRPFLSSFSDSQTFLKHHSLSYCGWLGLITAQSVAKIGTLHFQILPSGNSSCPCVNK